MFGKQTNQYTERGVERFRKPEFYTTVLNLDG